MASDITLSSSVRQNLLSLQNTADLMAKTQNRLATGKRVTSALDNPTNFFTAASLQSRSSDLNNLLDAMSNGIKTLEAADNGLKAITKTLEQMQSTLRQARQDRSFKTASYELDATAIGSDTAKSLSFSGGAIGSTPVDIALNSTSTTALSVASVEASADYAAPAASTAAETSFTFVGQDFDDAGSEISFDLTIDGETQTVTIDKTIADAASVGNDGNLDTIDEFQDALTAAITAAGFTGAGVSISNDGTDITLTSNTTGASSDLQIASTAFSAGGGAGVTAAGGIADAALVSGDDAEELTFTINGESVTLNGDDHSTATLAAAEIQSVLDAADIDITASVTGNQISLEGAADGSNDITIVGGDADDVFGAGRTVTAGDEDSDDGAVKSLASLVNAINSNADLAGKVRASNDNGKLRIENLSTSELTVTGVNDDGEIDGDTDAGAIGGNEVRADLAKQFNVLRDQLDKLSDDASFNGINLLRGDNLKITFNETGTSTISIQTKNGATVNSAYLDIADIDAVDLDTDTDIDATLETVGAALGTIRSQSSAFGSNLSVVENRQDFTKNMITTLQAGADKLTLADSNEEAANMLALQTRQQLSSTALSLASQADQAILRLF